MRLQLSKFLLIAILIVLSAGCGSKAVKDAQKYVDAGMYENALKLLEMEVSDNPKNAKAHIMMGECHLYLEQTDLAKEAFDRAILLDKANRKKVGEAYFKIGKTFLEKDRFDKVSSYFEKALDIDKAISKAVAEEYLTKAEKLKLKSPEPDNPIWCYTQAVEVEPELRGKVAEICFATAKDYLKKGFEDQSFQYAKKSIDLSPDYIKPGGEVYYSKGKAFFDSGDKAKAGKFLHMALSLNPKNETARNLMKEIKDFSSPTATWNTFKIAVREKDTDLLMECFSKEERIEVRRDRIDEFWESEECLNKALNSTIVKEVAADTNSRLLQIKVDDECEEVYFLLEDNEWRLSSRAAKPPEIQLARGSKKLHPKHAPRG